MLCLFPKTCFRPKSAHRSHSPRPQEEVGILTNLKISSWFSHFLFNIIAITNVPVIYFIPTLNVLTILIVALVVLNSSSRGGFSVASTNYFAVVSLPLKLIVSDHLCNNVTQKILWMIKDVSKHFAPVSALSI